MARERENEARLKWQEQLYSQIIIAQKAKEDALKSAIRADSARLVAIQKELDAQRARREAVRNARGSEAGRLALLAGGTGIWKCGLFELAQRVQRPKMWSFGIGI